MLKQEHITAEGREQITTANIKTVIKRPYIASMIGTILECYDNALYGFMAPILTGIFLPEMNRVNALILAFAIYPLGLISRPLGGFILGKMGDRLGRKRALIFSLTGMAIATGLIGCMPTYATIGLAAPILLALLNVAQKFFAGGEYNGGAIFMLEHSKKHKCFRSGLYCACAVSGILIAALIAATISYLPTGYWRIAYLLGFLTALFGLYLRKNIPETPEFQAINLKKQKISLKNSITHYKYSLLCSIGAAGFFSALYNIPAVFMNAFVPLVNDISTQQMLVINTLVLFIYMLVLPLFGTLADFLTARKSMIIAAIVTIIISYPLFLLLNANSLICIIIMKLCFVLLVAWFIAPFHAWIQDLYDVKNRYQLISLSYSIGIQFGSATPVLALWAWKSTGFIQIPAIFIISWALLGAISLLRAKSQNQTSDSNTSEIVADAM